MTLFSYIDSIKNNSTKGLTMNNINQDIINRAINMAEEEIDITIAQKAHKLHNGKSLKEIVQVDIFDDPCMIEDLNQYVADNIDETEEDQEFELVYAVYQYIMGRYSVWKEWAGCWKEWAEGQKWAEQA